MRSYSPQYIFDHFLPLVVALQIIMYVSLFLNLPLARQIIGLVYLTFIPGLIFLKLLKFNELGTLETIVFSVGFSVVFLMLTGLALDQFGYAVGLTFPLATLPLSLLINTLIIVGAAVTYLRGRSGQWTLTPPDSSFNLSLLVLAAIPALSIVGSYYSNLTGNNIFLLLMLIAVAVLFTVTALRNRSGKFYPFAILMIALGLLFHVSLTTNYILPYGGDSPAEFYIFQSTQLNGHWDPVFAFPTDEGLGRFHAMLSVTILPTIYSNVLGMDPTLVYKIVYPVIFAFVPVALYVLWQPYIGKKLSFFAAFLFMAQSTFFIEMTALTRQMVGELFFVLLFIVLLNKKLKAKSKFIGFSILSMGLIFSHYALAEIFLFLIVTAWAVSIFYLRKPSVNLQLSTIIFFSVAMFAWYIYTSGSVVFDSFVTFTGYVTSQLGDFFDPTSRGQTVLAGIGLAESPSFLNTISRVFAYLTEILIVLGVVALIRKKTQFRFERDFTVFSLIALAFLISLTVVPGLANTLNMTRFYHILLMVLAPFCIVGMWALAQFVTKKRKLMVFSLIAIAILVPYFLFQTNFVYEVSGARSWSVPLSAYRMDPIDLYANYGYQDSYSISGSQWVSKNVPYEYNLASDIALFTSLTAYGMIYRGYMVGLDNETILRPGEFVFLSYISVNYEPTVWKGELDDVLNYTDIVYSNGGSIVHYKPAP